MKKVLVYNIKWDTDGEEVDLPQEMRISVHAIGDDELEEFIADEISNITGFCHDGFLYKFI